MKTKLSLTVFALAIATAMFAQPDQFPVAIDPAEENTLLTTKREISMQLLNTPITVDGVKDVVWDSIIAAPFDRYIKEFTKYEAGVYSKVSMLSDGPSPTRRLPDNNADFSGTYRVTYDEDYLYCFFDITDNEINDGGINPINEELEFQEAPYSDSARQMLGTNPYPPYTGTAGEMNKRYCYWAYLGAFKMNFKLIADGKCEVSFRQKADAIAMINYDQRAASCHCAWKTKTNGDGYTAEVAISLKIALADSTGTPFEVPGYGEKKWISFEMKAFDRDLNMKDIQASWNATDNNVWDAMIFGGKLLMKHEHIGLYTTKTSTVTFSPNPVTDLIMLSEKAETIEVISINGSMVKRAQQTQELVVSDLANGFYLLKINGLPAGKFIKE